MSAWLSMGGYAAYVWPAYGLVLIVLLLQALGIKCQRSRVRKKLIQWFKGNVNGTHPQA